MLVFGGVEDSTPQKKTRVILDKQLPGMYKYCINDFQLMLQGGPPTSYK